MSTEPKKQERDYTPEVDALLPEVDGLAKVCGCLKGIRDVLN